MSGNENGAMPRYRFKNGEAKDHVNGETAARFRLSPHARNRLPKTIKIGRSSRFSNDMCDHAYQLCAKHAYTNDMLADFFRVHTLTISAWLKDNPTFHQAVTEGRAVADGKVESALYQRAIGYQHQAVKFMMQPLGGKRGSQVVAIPYTEKYAPDVGAIMNWLANRCRDRWKIRQDTTIGNPDDTPILPNFDIVPVRSRNVTIEG